MVCLVVVNILAAAHLWNGIIRAEPDWNNLLHRVVNDKALGKHN